MVEFIADDKIDISKFQSTLIVELNAKETICEPIEQMSKMIDGVRLNVGVAGSNVVLSFSWDDQDYNLSEKSESYFELRHIISEQIRKSRSTYKYDSLVVSSSLDLPSQFLESSLITDIHRLHCDSSYKTSDIKNFHVCSKFNKEATEHHLKSVGNYEIKNREWVNENPDTFTSLEIGRILKQFSAKSGCSFEELNEEALLENGLNLLLEVGKASTTSPSRLFVLSKNLEKSGDPLVLVGKAITFDTGGINVKHHDAYVNCMKNDMAGGAMAMTQFMALVESGYERPIVLVIPACENLVDGRSMKPGSIVTSHKGTNVIIEHTDAEGRLILADALSYASSKFNASATIVFATLTTAALRQYTGYYTPLHFASSDFQQKLLSNAERFGENFVFCNELRVFRSANQKDGVGLTNIGSLRSRASMGGGSNVAAHFCKHFVEGPYMHFDIFGSGWNWSDDYPGANYGATGAGFYSVFETLRNYGD